MFTVTKTDEEWKAILTAEQFQVQPKESTERPFTNQYQDNKRPGRYPCAGRYLPVFSPDLNSTAVPMKAQMPIQGFCWASMGIVWTPPSCRAPAGRNRADSCSAKY